jgi:hypothetical protein
MILDVVCTERNYARKGRVIAQQKGSRLTKILNIFDDSSHQCTTCRTQLQCPRLH